MNHASFFHGSVSQWSNAQNKQRFYWVVIGICGVLGAAKLASMASHHFRAAASSPSSAAASLDDGAAANDAKNTENQDGAATAVAPQAVNREPTVVALAVATAPTTDDFASTNEEPAQQSASQEDSPAGYALDAAAALASSGDPSAEVPGQDHACRGGVITQVLAALAAPRSVAADGATADDASPADMPAGGEAAQSPGDVESPAAPQDGAAPPAKQAGNSNVDRALEFLLGSLPAEVTDAQSQGESQPSAAGEGEPNQSSESASTTDNADSEAAPAADNPHSPAGGEEQSPDTTSDSAMNRATAAQEVVLSNPYNSGGPVKYLANGFVFTIAPGELQRFPADRPWRIQFHRGGDFGNVDLSLAPAVYEFSVGEIGWELNQSAK